MLRPLVPGGLSGHRRLASYGLRRHQSFLPGVCHAKKGSSSGSGSSSSPWGTPPSKKTAKSSGGGGQKGGSKGNAAAQGKKQQPKQRPKQAPAKQEKQEQAAAAPVAVQTGQPGLTKLSAPLQQQLLEALSPWESAPAPRWGTFCNHLEGEWLGQYCAVTPWAGDPEPVWADPQGQYVTHVFTRTVESRLEDDGSSSSGSSSSSRADDGDAVEPRDLMTRVTARGATAEAVAALQLPRGLPPIFGSGGGSSISDEAVADEYESLEVEAWSSSDYGAVIFDGGSYSLGPDYIGALNDEELAAARGDDSSGGMDVQQAEALGLLHEEEEGDGSSSSNSSSSSGRAWEQADGADAGGAGDDDDDDDDEAGSSVPSRTFIVEQCLCLGGNARVRLKVTLKTRTAPGKEMDVEVARVVVSKEHWYGLPSSPSDPTPSPTIALLPSHDLQSPITAMPRPTPAQLSGDWNVFTFCATAVEDVDMATGKMAPMWVYSGREERRAFSVLPGGEDGVEEGGSYWLPGGVVATIRMVAQQQQQHGQQEGQASSNGASSNGAASSNATASSNGTPSSNGMPSSNGATASSNGSSSSSSGSSNNQGGTCVAVGVAPQPRGLVLSLVWLLDAKTALLMERSYDGEGVLLEVSQGTAVRGGWSGGQM